MNTHQQKLDSIRSLILQRDQYLLGEIEKMKEDSWVDFGEMRNAAKDAWNAALDAVKNLIKRK